MRLVGALERSASTSGARAKCRVLRCSVLRCSVDRLVCSVGMSAVPMAGPGMRAGAAALGNGTVPERAEKAGECGRAEEAGDCGMVPAGDVLVSCDVK